MNNMSAMVWFLLVITSASSILSVSSDNDQEIFEVVDDLTSMHHAGMELSKVEIGKFLFEDGKVLTLSRRSSPSRNCITPDQPCGMLDWCCEGLYCDGRFDGRCNPSPTCYEYGRECGFLNTCCYPYTCNHSSEGHCA